MTAIFKENDAPPTPPAGYVAFYCKTDGLLYYKDDAGVELPIKPVGGGTGDLLSDGTVPLTANWDVGAFKIIANQLESDVATGTAPLIVASTTLVSNLNADLLDGNEAAAFAVAAHTHEGTAILSTGEAGGTKFLREDGDNTCSWQALPASLANVVEDTTPQLGGSLDVNGQKIVSVTNGNIDIEPHGTGNVLLGNFTLDADQAVGVGQDNYVFTYDNATGLISLEAAPGGGLANVVEDTTPQLGGALDGQGHDLNNLGVVFLTEQAAAEADVAGKGQFWVKTETPNVPMFTDDAGTDFNLQTPEGTAIKSTGEAGGTKFLREDGDGTSSWQTVFDGKQYVGVNDQTGLTYELVLGDAGKLVTMSNASPNTLTIPANASVAFAVGTRIDVLQKGGGQTTVAITSDTLNGAGGLKINAQWEVVSLLKIASTTWVLVGGVA